MEKISFSSGLRKYQLGDFGVLQFNPSDPNVYKRFVDAIDRINAVEETLEKRAKEIDEEEESFGTGEKVLQFMHDADQEVKKILNWIFGVPNDFDKILAGTNLLAVCENDERLITNLMEALTPVMQEGAESCAKKQAIKTVEQIKGNRQQRRTAK